MADFSVPILPIGGLDTTIAKGPDLSWIGNIPNAYWQGQDQAFKSRNQDLFQQGIPRDASGNIDWNKASQIMLQAGGAAALPAAVSLQNYDLERRALENEQRRQGGASSGFPALAVAQPQPQSETPQAPAQGTATLRQIAQARTIPIEELMRANAGVNPDAPLDFEQRKAVIANYGGRRVADAGGTPAFPPSVSGPPAQAQVQPQQQAQAQPLPQAQQQQVTPPYAIPPERIQAIQSEMQAQQEEARHYFGLAAAFGIGKSPAADQYKAQGEAAAKRALALQESLQRILEPTNEMKTAAASGYRNPLDYSGAVAEQTKQIGGLEKLADNGIEAKGKIAQLNAVQQLGENVGYGVTPKLQSFLGQYGIETKGLSDIQAYERAISALAPQLRPIGSGRLLQNELTAFKNALGGLMTTPEGRRISIENLKLINNYSAQVGTIAADASLSPAQRMRDIYAMSPPKLDIKVPEAGPSAPARSSGTVQAAPQFQEGQTATNPTTGAKAVFRNGQWMQGL